MSFTKKESKLDVVQEETCKAGAGDMLVQYRRMISLMKRDKQVRVYNENQNKASTTGDVQLLCNETEEMSRKLREAKQGNKIKIRTIMKNHRDLQMAYSELPSESIIEHINQKVFNLRKTKDRQYCVKSRLMADFKEVLEYKSVIEDRVELEKAGFKNEWELSLQLLSCAVEAQRIRNNAALTVRNAYQAAVQIMIKESLRYDPLTRRLEHDLKVQNSMLLLAILMGQMAVETKEEMKSEIQNLEQLTRQSIAVRQRDLTLMKQENKLFTKNLKSMVRSETDILLQSLKDINKTEGNNGLDEDREFLNDLVDQIKRFTKVSTIDDILPRFEDQLQKYVFLCFLRDHMTFKCDNVIMQLNHADLQLTIAIYSFDKERALYLTNKQELLDAIELQNERKTKYNDEMLLSGNLLTLIRDILRNLVDSMDQVQTGSGKKQPDALNREESGDLRTNTPRVSARSPSIKQHQPNDWAMPKTEDSPKLLLKAMTKLQTLIKVFHDLEPELKRKAQALFSSAMVGSSTRSDVSKEEMDLLEGIIVQDHSVPTYKSLKMESGEIVDDNLLMV